MNWIETGTSGSLAIMPRPEGSASLEAVVAEWRAEGVGLVVSALEHEEEAYLGLSHEASLCERSGIDFIRFPIGDRLLPEARPECARLIEDLAERVRAGGGVLVHCRVGIGRSGMICAATLIALGFDPEEAIRRVTDARGMEIPDTWDQRAWIYEFGKGT